MEYTGKNKIAAELQPGDFVATTGYLADASEVETIDPIGDRIHVKTANGKGATWLWDKVVRLYV